MYRAVFSILLLILFAVMVLVETNIVYGAEYGSKSLIVVPRDYPTIQEAVDNAPSGALILVYSGVYRENIVISGKTGITVEGEPGTVIEGYIYVYSSSSIVLRNLAIKTGSTGVSIYKAKNVTVEKFNLTYTGGSGSLKPSGIYVWWSFSITIKDSIVRGYITGITIYKSDNVTVNHTWIYASTGIDVTDAVHTVLASNIIYSRRGINVKSLTGYSPIILKLLNNQIIGSADMEAAIYVGGITSFTFHLYAVANEIYYPEGYLIINFLPSGSNTSGYAYLNRIYVNNTDHFGIVWYSPSPLYYAYNGRNYTGYLGNYWHLYNGSDTNGDGIGDEPFNFNGLHDPYPICPGSFMVEGFEFDGPDRIVIHLWNGSSITEEYSSEGLSFTGYAEYIAYTSEEKYELMLPVNITVSMKEAANGLRVVSTTELVSIVESRVNDSLLWLNITLEDPGIVAVYVPGSYSVMDVYKNGVLAGYMFNETSSTLIIGDPVNVSILLLNNTSGSPEGDTGGEKVPPMPEPPILPVIVMSAVLAGIVLKKRR